MKNSKVKKSIAVLTAAVLTMSVQSFVLAAEESENAQEDNAYKVESLVENENTSDEKEMSQKDQYIEYLENIMTEYPYMSKPIISLYAYSRIKKSRALTAGENLDESLKLNGTQRKQVANFFKEVYDVIEKNITIQMEKTEVEQKLKDLTKGYVDYRAYLAVGDGNLGLYFSLEDNYIQSNWLNGYVENPQIIIDFIAEKMDTLWFVLKGSEPIVYDPNIRAENVDFDKQLINGTPYELVEKITFDVKAGDEFYDTLVEEIADLNTTIHCQLENIDLPNESTRDIFLLKMSGNKDTRYYFAFNDEMEYNSGNSGNWLEFWDWNTFDGENLYTENNETALNYFRIYATPKNDKIEQLTVKFKSFMYALNFFPTLEATNIEYQFLLDNPTQMQTRRSLAALFGVEKYDMLTEEEKARVIAEAEARKKADEEATAEEEARRTGHIKPEDSETTDKTENTEKQEENKEDNKSEDNKTPVEQVTKLKFPDVPENHWAYKEINDLADKNVIRGYGNGYFGTDDSIIYNHLGLLLDRLFNYKAENTSYDAAIREDIIAYVVKALEIDVKNVDESIIEKNFSDCGDLKPENKRYIAAAIEKGLVIGSDGKLNPKSQLTRAETAVLLYRAINFNSAEEAPAERLHLSDVIE